MRLSPVDFGYCRPDAIETEVTNEVDALGLGSRSGLGSVEVSHVADRAMPFANREGPARRDTGTVH